MRIAQDNSAITNLIAFQNRYTGPGAVSVTPDDYASAEEVHKKLVHRKLEKWEPATKAALSGVCRRFISWCEADTHTSNDYRIFAYPATRVAAFLESERQRHIWQGTSPAVNVANAFTEMVRLSAIQGCPDFNSAEMAHMQVLGGIAMLDRVQQNLTADPDFKRRGNQAVLTSDDIENHPPVIGLSPACHPSVTRAVTPLSPVLSPVLSPLCHLCCHPCCHPSVTLLSP